MDNKPQPAQLKDMLSYTPETYFSEDELALIRSTFNGPTGAKILKVIRKTMLPTVSDMELPLEEVSKDMFFNLVDFTTMQTEEVKATAMGIQHSAKTIIGGLIYLKTLANIKDESPAEKALRESKNSSK